MNEIKLLVNDENLETVLTIINNLKVNLISNIYVNDKIKFKSSQYQPKTNTVIKEENSCINDKSGKYSVSAYRDRLKKN